MEEEDMTPEWIAGVLDAAEAECPPEFAAEWSALACRSAAGEGHTAARGAAGGGSACRGADGLSAP